MRCVRVRLATRGPPYTQSVLVGCRHVTPARERSTPTAMGPYKAGNE